MGYVSPELRTVYPSFEIDKSYHDLGEQAVRLARDSPLRMSYFFRQHPELMSREIVWLAEDVMGSREPLDKRQDLLYLRVIAEDMRLKGEGNGTLQSLQDAIKELERSI